VNENQTLTENKMTSLIKILLKTLEETVKQIENNDDLG
jgi:hypothetical protein